MITAEELARNEYGDDSHIHEFMERQIDMKHAIWMMQVFARKHVKEALKQASENNPQIKFKDNILKAYDLDNIK